MIGGLKGMERKVRVYEAWIQASAGEGTAEKGFRRPQRMEEQMYGRSGPDIGVRNKKEYSK